MTQHTASGSSERWSTVPLGEVAAVQTGVAKGKTPKNGSVSLPYLRVANVQDGFLDLSEIKEIEISPAEASRYQLRAGDVLFTEGGDFDKLGRGTVWRGQINPCLHQNHLFAVRPNEQALLPEFLAYVAASPIGRRYFISCSKQSTNLASINSTQLKQFPVPLPPLPEQRRIAAILGTWDAAIEKAERVLTAKINRREHWHTALVAQFDGSTKPLHELITPVQRPVPRPSKPYTAVGIRSHGKGTFHRHVSRPEQIDMDTLFVVTATDLIINITFAWEGAIALAKPEDQGCLVSHRFPTFEINEVVVNRDYLGFAVNNARFFYALRGISPGSAGRNRVLNQKDFLRLSIPFPPKKQQDRIAELLTAADKDIAATGDLIARLKTQKSGLMQKLLTGKIRVPEAVADLSPAAD